MGTRNIQHRRRGQCDHVLNNKCQVALIGKKYEKAMAKYLPEMELLRDAAEAKAERHKKAGGERKKGAGG